MTQLMEWDTQARRVMFARAYYTTAHGRVTVPQSELAVLVVNPNTGEPFAPNAWGRWEGGTAFDLRVARAIAAVTGVDAYWLAMDEGAAVPENYVLWLNEYIKHELVERNRKRTRGEGRLGEKPAPHPKRRRKRDY